MQRVAAWDGENGAMALMTGGQLVGLYSLSRDAMRDLAARCPSTVGSIGEIHTWLTCTQSVQFESVPDDRWQRVLTAQQCRLAEQKLDQWLVKPTDGIFARMNRRVSIPISRQLIPFPITPNMVSLFTLGVSFAAGALFALGGYWNVLSGAALSVFASILDGCDGEVARLKLQESDFGCWLETICDYLYYLFIFAGMTIGLVRSSGNRSYLVWGGLLVFGAVASFLATGLQRHQLATGRPEQYLRNWHAKADSRRSNPLLYLGRHTEFIIRRCFLPYAFLVFALLNIMNWALVGAALGANVVWIIALYSYRAFATAQASTVSPA
jgi:phosphatidylglycerophosphate synthase